MAAAPTLEFEAVRVEGGLLPPDYLLTVANLAAPAQDAADYGVPRGLTVRDEIGRAWRITEAAWRDLQALGPAPGARRDRAVLALLREAFGWVTITPLDAPAEVADRAFPLAALALDGRAPVVLAGGEEGLDDATRRHGDGSRRRSPFGLLQEYLNAAESAQWGLVTNGMQLRVVRDNASLTRPAWIEADLARIVTEQRYADFSLLWLLLHQSRFGPARRETAGSDGAADVPLEQWRTAALAKGTVARDRLRDGVEQALRALGTGFLAHPQNGVLRDALARGALSVGEYHQQLLRLVYRVILLMVAEERELLHPDGSDTEAIALYRAGYGVQRLRDRAAQRRAYDRHDDAWESLRVVWRGCAVGESRLALPGLGGLFASEQCAALDAARLGNRHLLEGVFHLTWLREASAIVRVNWRDMGTEELGSVYESLLELVPEVRDDGRAFGFVGDGGAAGGSATAGNARKLTGSYFTPDSLVQALLESALDPVIDRAVRQPDPEQALLGLAVLDPAMGSGHFLLGAARRLAARLAGLRVDGTPGPAAYRQALREVVAHCVYGVDKNAMAVELARMALWLEAMEPGKPLAFLDHHLVHGDAILGVQDPAVLLEGIPKEAFATLTGDDAEVAGALRKANAASLKALVAERKGGQLTLDLGGGRLAEALATVDALPDDTLDAVATKRAALASARGEATGGAAARLRLACDAYVAAFVMRKAPGHETLVPTTATLRDLAAGIPPGEAMQAAVAREAADAPYLHWPIAFAPVVARGGFDCVLGNPPWEKLKLSEEEFFAARDPEIAGARTAAERERLIEARGRAAAGSPARRLFDELQSARHALEGASNFARNGGRFPLTGTGDVNLYALFAEAMLAVMHPEGRAGVVVPSGIASDKGTAPFFGHLMDGRLVSLLDFENRDALFAGVHRSYKFSLLTLGASATAQFAFFLSQPVQRHDARRRFTLSRDEVRRLNPNTGNAPVFRSQADAALAAKIYRHVPVLWDETREDGNPWGLSFGTLFHMSNDSRLFRRSPGPGLVPLYEAKLMHQFDHRWATYTGGGEDDVRAVTEAEKADPTFAVRPRYWVPQAEVEERLAAKGWSQPWLLGWRDITNATNERTVIASVLPRVGVGNTLPLVFVQPHISARQVACLIAVLNSLVLDYCARQKIGGTHLNYFVLRQVPMVEPVRLPSEEVERMSMRVAALTTTDEAMGGWRQALGAEKKDSLSAVDQLAVRAELDALVARAFGLARADLEFVLDPKQALGEDYPSETFRILKESEIRRFGEYRTRRLVLEAWDRLFGSA